MKLYNNCSPGLSISFRVMRFREGKIPDPIVQMSVLLGFDDRLRDESSYEKFIRGLSHSFPFHDKMPKYQWHTNGLVNQLSASSFTWGWLTIVIQDAINGRHLRWETSQEMLSWKGSFSLPENICPHSLLLEMCLAKTRIGSLGQLSNM